jgi:hypothetical protein
VTIKEKVEFYRHMANVYRDESDLWKPDSQSHQVNLAYSEHFEKLADEIENSHRQALYAKLDRMATSTDV